MSEKENKVRYLRCLQCLKIIKCSSYDTECLIRHVQTHHPEIIDVGNDKVKNLHKLAADHGISEERLSEISKMTGMTEAEMADEAERYLSKRKNQTGSQPSKNPSQDLQEPKINDFKDINKRQYYRSSIERWTATDGCIYCPSCGCNRRPLLKSSSEFYASTGCSFACVANCWPFCFMPCLSLGDNREYLHCSNCKSFLGTYNRENNCIRPNREFVQNS